MTPSERIAEAVKDLVTKYGETEATAEFIRDLVIMGDKWEPHKVRKIIHRYAVRALELHDEKGTADIEMKARVASGQLREVRWNADERIA